MTLERARGQGKRVVVALSGGVDSSVAALLLKRSGFDVIGITMKNFCYAESDVADRSCCSVESIEDAKRVCSRLGIGHQVVDVEELFAKEIVENFISEYKRARTPNPCVRCNSSVRFDKLSLLARTLGAEFVATGHYARLYVSNEGERFLAKAEDEEKDQSYFLSALSKRQIANLLLPLGEYKKEQVRAIAREASLPVAQKRDSQEVCFITHGDLRTFLEQKLDFRPGPIVNTSGEVLGTHEGIFSYTIGQRKNLGLSASRPHYVLRLDPGINALVVGGENELYKRELSCSPVWVDDGLADSLSKSALAAEGALKAKIRSRHNPAPVESVSFEEAACRVRFKEPQKAVCPGQTIAFYAGDLVVGSGIIDGAYD